MKPTGRFVKGMPHWTDADYLAKLKSRCTITESGCWIINGFLWDSGSKYTTGYGSMCYRGKNWRANRLAYFLVKGPIPEGKLVRHTCDTPSCCNPDHLVAGTQEQNIADCIERGRQRFHPSHYTHCNRGHEYTEANNMPYTDKRGYTFRRCRTCVRARTRRAAGWPENMWYLPADPLGFRPAFTEKTKGDQG